MNPEEKSFKTLDYDPECEACVRNKDSYIYPSHTASNNCSSGRNPHCTCDTCF